MSAEQVVAIREVIDWTITVERDDERVLTVRVPVAKTFADELVWAELATALRLAVMDFQATREATGG